MQYILFAIISIFWDCTIKVKNFSALRDAREERFMNGHFTKRKEKSFPESRIQCTPIIRVKLSSLGILTVTGWGKTNSPLIRVTQSVIVNNEETILNGFQQDNGRSSKTKPACIVLRRVVKCFAVRVYIYTYSSLRSLLSLRRTSSLTSFISLSIASLVDFFGRARLSDCAWREWLKVLTANCH